MSDDNLLKFYDDSLESNIKEAISLCRKISERSNIIFEKLLAFDRRIRELEDKIRRIEYE